MATVEEIRARTDAIRRRALELGFHKVGFAPAADADPDDRLRAWLARGFAADMAYMERTAETRADPRRLVPGARSVIALAVSYYRPEAEPVGPYKISRYAVIDDYHGMLKKRVRKLRKLILELDPEAKVHPGCDTSPVLERAWAERAGVAWIGKSTMAIAQDLGTYTFLATLITTTELDYDDPHPDRCGSCTRCLDACPTNAFAGPHQLDARKCITYWTIEHRAPFDERTPRDFEGWIGGCDVCQEVCPWNKFARPTEEPRWVPRPELVAPEPERWKDADHVEAVIRGTPLTRPGTTHLMRSIEACYPRKSMDASARASLNDGNSIPWIGLGVFRSPEGEATENAVLEALRLGYRHIDTAAIYRNERSVGEAIKKSGIPREEIFVTTKLWNEDHTRAEEALEESLARLGLDYVDLYLIHWPVEKLRFRAWRALEGFKKDGRARSIGVSNYLVPHLEELFERAEILPAVNQIELHPYNYGHRRATVELCRKHHIRLEAYCPLTRGRRLDDPALIAIAEKYGKTTAQVLIRWGLEHDLVVLPKSTRAARIEENFDVFDYEISTDDLEALDGLDEGMIIAWDPATAA